MADINLKEIAINDRSYYYSKNRISIENLIIENIKVGK